jgi:hypothetical protein
MSIKEGSSLHLVSRDRVASAVPISIVAQERMYGRGRQSFCRKLVTYPPLQQKAKLGILGLMICLIRRLPMENIRDPRQHVNEEPRDDFMDTAIGFAVMFGFMVVVFLGAVIIKAVIS